MDINCGTLHLIVGIWSAAETIGTQIITTTRQMPSSILHF